MKKISLKKIFHGVTKNTVLLGLGSLFADISTEMLYPVLPIYLTQTLKAGGGVVGIVEGFAIAAQNIVQGLSGWISDKIHKRKPIAVLGYTIAALSKPLIGVANVWQGVLGARILDRTGTGIRSAPRDALIASSVEEEHRGKAFGLEGVGDNLGAFLGPILAIFLLYVLHFGIRHIFLIALIPGLLAVLMILLVSEKKKFSNASVKSKLDLKVSKFPKEYWKYLIIIALSGIGNFSTSFLILRTKNIGVSLLATIFIYAIYNLIAALASYPSGFLSDKIGRKNLVIFSIFIFVLTYLGFALSKNILVIAFLFILYGIYQGIFRAIGKVWATDFIPAELRASGIGWYMTTVGLSGLAMSIIAGQLWDRVSHEAVFFYGATTALVGALAIIFFVPGVNAKR